MIWIFLVAAILFAAAAAVAWWGSDILFHPPKMLRPETWPDRYGLVYEPVEFRTPDALTLKGWLIPASAETDKTLLMCHGWGDNMGDLLERTHSLAREFNLFFFDSRQHGESEGSHSTIGCLESIDVEAALEFLKGRRPAWVSNLGAFGLSMGAVVAVWAAARHPEIKAVCIESPYASFNGVVAQWTRNELHLPYFPFAWLTLAVIRLRLGRDPEPYSPLYHIDRIAPRPLLVVAGGADRLMPPGVVRRVFDRAGSPKELWEIPNARHGKCWEEAGEEYPQRLLEFFRKNL